MRFQAAPAWNRKHKKKHKGHKAKKSETRK